VWHKMNTEQWGLQARATGGGGTYPSLEKAKMDKQLNYTSAVICICCRSQVQEITEVSSNSLMHDFHILFVL